MSLEAFKPEPWMADAVCASTDPELFFPDLGGSTRSAKQICAGCPVRDRCLQFALARHETGIWGGTSDGDRKRMRREAA